MKHSVIIGCVLFSLLLFNHHVARAQGYDITVRIRNCKDTEAYLGYNFGDQKFVKDTSGLIGGNTFRFADNARPLPPGVYFIYSPNLYFEFIVNEPRFTLETDTIDFVGHMKIEGSRENRIFNAFQQFMAGKQLMSRKIAGRIDSLQKLHDSTAIAGLREQLKQISEDVRDYQNDLIKNNRGTYVARLIQAMQKPEVPDHPENESGEVPNRNWRFYYYKKHFFDHFDLADSGLLRSPVYQPKVDEYIDNLTYQDPDSIEAAADYLLKLAEPNKETYRYLLVKLTSKYESSNIMGMERVFVYLAENYYLKGKAFWADSSLIAKFDKRVKELKPNLVGNIAPDMQLIDTLMRPVKLSSLHSRFTVLYFYDHDCGHCKKETPVLRDIYQKKLKKLGVTIWAADVMTNLTNDMDPDPSIKKWKEFIRSDHLDGWIHVADPYFHDYFRSNYDVKMTPTIYILNSKREIIAKRLGVEQIADFIEHTIQNENKKDKGL